MISKSFGMKGVFFWGDGKLAESRQGPDDGFLGLDEVRIWLRCFWNNVLKLARKMRDFSLWTVFIGLVREGNKLFFIRLLIAFCKLFFCVKWFEAIWGITSVSLVSYPVPLNCLGKCCKRIFSEILPFRTLMTVGGGGGFIFCIWEVFSFAFV